jgi:hypothetical protein
MDYSMNPNRPSSPILSSPSTVRRRRRACSLTIAAAAALAVLVGRSAPAKAELVIYEKDSWSVSTEGRANAFYSYAHGKGRPLDLPPANPAPGAGIEHPLDNQNNIDSSRIRSGFVGTVLGFNVKKQITQTLSMKAHLAIWWTIEQRRTIGAGINSVDGREAYLKVEGTWGAVQGGRTLGLYGRGNILLNADYAHGNGIGYPCDLATTGPACGHVGFGVQYPGFTPSIRYMTPDTLGGFSFEGGIFDPVVLGGRFERTPYPRVEAEAAYAFKKEEDFLHAKAWLSGTWQRLLGYNESPTTPKTIKSADATGIAYGIRGGVGPVRAGFAGWTGKGLGITYPLENTQYPADAELELRRSDGFYAQLMATVAATDICLGWGVNRLHENAIDTAPPVKEGVPQVRQNVVKSQMGISAGVWHHWEALTFGVEYFRADYLWVYGNGQIVNFVNAGGTFKW